MKFATVINCMDGRVQLPVQHFLRERFGVDYVDTITEAGPNLILATQEPVFLADSIVSRLQRSIALRGTLSAIAVVAHHDCGGNPAAKPTQLKQLEQAVDYVRALGHGIETIGLWVNERWEVEEISAQTH